LGSVVPIATGSALASKLSNAPGVTAVFYGDGASEEGVVYESLNFAALFRLPIVFVIENNLYSVMSKLKDRRSADHNQEKITKGLGVEYFKVDGNDYADVYRTAKKAVANAAEGAPVLLECMTFRHMAHSAPLFDDKLCYRDIDVPEERTRQCPIKKIRTLLTADGVQEEELRTIEISTLESCRQVIEKASQSPYPDPAELMTGVYAQ